MFLHGTFTQVGREAQQTISTVSESQEVRRGYVQWGGGGVKGLRKGDGECGHGAFVGGHLYMVVMLKSALPYS